MSLKTKRSGKSISKHSSMPPSSLHITALFTTVHFIGLNPVWFQTLYTVNSRFYRTQSEPLCISKVCPKPLWKSALLSTSPLTQPAQLFSLYPCTLQVFAASRLLPLPSLFPPSFNFVFHAELFSLPPPTTWVCRVKLTVLGHGSTRSVFVYLLEVEQVCC